MSTKHFLLWLPMIAIAFANAAIRQLVFVKYFNQLRAHQLSTISLIILCALYVGFIFPFINVRDSKQAISIGLMWVGLTVLFEISLGRLTNRSWENLLQDYNIIAGRLWLLFLICLCLMPYVFYLLKKSG